MRLLVATSICLALLALTSAAEAQSVFESFLRGYESGQRQRQVQQEMQTDQQQADAHAAVVLACNRALRFSLDDIEARSSAPAPTSEKQLTPDAQRAEAWRLHARCLNGQ